MVAGIDIGGTAIKMALLEESSQIIAKRVFPSKKFHDPADFLGYVGENLKDLLKDRLPIDGIGIGAPAVDSRSGVIISAANLAAKNIPLREYFQNTFQTKVEVINDADALALGEKTFGAALDMTDFMTVTLGTGLGSGLFVNGGLVTGFNGRGGEMGHTLAVPRGRKCGCGKKGCLETYASVTGLITTVLELLNETSDKSILRNVDYARLTGEKIASAAHRGDAIANKAFEYTGEILGKQVAEVVTLLDLEAVLVGGGLAKAGDLLFKPLIRSIGKSTPSYNQLKVMPSALPEEDGGILGAASLIIRDGPT